MSSSDWKTIELRDVFEVRNEKLGSHEVEPPVFAISKHSGVVLGTDYHDRRVASANLEGYKILGALDWAYSTIHIDEGSIARNKHGFTGVVSPMYTILRWTSDDHDPRYFEYLLQSPRMLAMYGDMAQGSINRRRSLPWKTFSAISVSVPPLPEQRRIVDLVESVDDAIETGDRAFAAATQMYKELLTSFGAERASLRPLSDALTRVERSTAVKSDAKYRIIGLERSGEGFIDRGEVRGADIGYARLTAVGSDQLVYRKLTAWEGPISVSDGNVAGTWVSGEFPVFDVNADLLLPDLLRHICRWPGFWEKMAALLTGSVLRRKRLNPEQLLRIEIPMPDREIQEEILGLLDAVWGTLKAAQLTAQCRRQLRVELLFTLLSGKHIIPATYDELTGG